MMIEFGLGFLCCAVIFIYVNLRAGKVKPGEPLAFVLPRKEERPDNRKARQHSTEQYKAQMRAVINRGQ